MRPLLMALALMALLVGAWGASGDIPEVLSYQGVLRDSAGDPVPDGTYDITFRIYDVETGGAALWTEAQAVPVSDGIMNAYLGDVVSITTLDFDSPYWLGISVGADPELTPRTRLATVPYAARAVYAIEADADWEIDGDDVYHQDGNVGIGTSVMDSRFEVAAGDARGADLENSSGMSNFTIRARNLGGTAGGFYSGTSSVGYPGTPTAVYGVAGGTGQGGFFVARDDGTGLIGQSQGSGPALRGWAFGTGLSGYFTGGQGVLVEGPIDVDGFTMSAGASPGYVLTSDASGVGTWQASSGGIGGGGTVNYVAKFTGASTVGNSVLYDNGADVGLGTTSTSAKLDIVESGSGEALEVNSTSAGSMGRVVDIQRTGTVAAGNDIVQIVVPGDADEGAQFIECELGSNNIVFAVDTDGHFLTEAGGTSHGQLYVTSDWGAPVDARYYGTSHSSIGVYGRSIVDGDYGTGGKFIGGQYGVEGEVEPTDGSLSPNYYGVYGHVLNQDGTNDIIGVVGNGGSNADEGTVIGVYGRAGGQYSSNYGVYGSYLGGSVAYAVYSWGDCHVTGTLTKGAGAFQIDHPLDPENMYLRHSFVESPDMKNVYDGVVVLDASGKAWIELPEWFEALNEDFRYQLTPIGAPGPNLYIAEEISGNSFAIAGGDPGMKVSWQVTGIRHDRYAEAHRIVVEEAKRPEDLGKYSHPELYGRSIEEAIGYVAPPETSQHEVGASASEGAGDYRGARVRGGSDGE